ncbi:TPA: GNAT family N-acetyltransferase [Serratia rubidaea]|nr:GNAT family N-acetyltransferase [Serratia rubidaea]HDJ1450002.1 GNAT family N-acetyltransferase [Serratia rubidaea]HDJ1463807.1 GNAT family N-acetyltransferase [Serratia rubidaea]HDJ2772339.1 GNAT family N-acetyltransferase [Serratia rubidaea]
MEKIIETLYSLEQINEREYREFHDLCGAPLFYDWRFLQAAENSPLLPVKATYYLTMRIGGKITAFMPIYLQRMDIVDPFKVLEQKADMYNSGDDYGLFSHVMHCFNSTILNSSDDPNVYYELMLCAREMGEAVGARYFGLLNVEPSPLLTQSKQTSMQVNYMFDRYYVDLPNFSHFNHFVECLPYDGRGEMRRQMRKFTNSGARASIVAPPFDQRLEQLCELCFQTTARHGTPQYFPARPLASFCRQCGDLIRLNLIERDGELLAGMVCFQEQGRLHLWSAGMKYEGLGFSPYTICFANAYQYAFEQGLQRVEAGRLNAKIKTRLGLQPLPLYAVTSRTPLC